MTIVSAIILLFLVMDPFGNIPLFLPALANIDPKRRTRVVVRELLIALVALILFLFTGRYLLQVLQLSEPALTIAGGIILFLIAIRMVFPPGDNSTQEHITGEPFIVPLAIPYVAGPSAISAVLLLSSRQPSAWAQWLFAIVVAWLASSIILLASSAMSRYLGDRGIIAIERLMGMILVTVAVQMTATGITHFLALPR
jgi:multiple antibiotic resistance protein